jgi:hypothetical protein
MTVRPKMSRPYHKTHHKSASTDSAGVKVAQILNLRPAFLRSVNVALDYRDPTSSRDYVVTGFIREVLDRVVMALRRNSTERAWRVTGDYGSGKSAFALSFARIAAGQRGHLPEVLRSYVPAGFKLEPVLVSGAPESIEASIRKALADLRARVFRSVPKALLKAKPGHAALLELIDEHITQLRKQNIADGVVIILDELGQNLHHAALHPSRGDVSFLQELGEKADRSQDRPLLVMAMLHQGLGTYSADLDLTAKKEWDKVAGRFKEVIFAHPIEQVVSLVAQMLGVNYDDLTSDLQRQAKVGMKAATAGGLYGSAPAEVSLASEAHRFFPLHPTVLPILVRLLRRFAQNERSLVGFLSSHEPFGFREYAETHALSDGFYRIPHLYDYFCANLAPTLVNGQAAHWNVIDTAVGNARSLGEPAISVLKTVGLINLLNDHSIVATEAVVVAALGSSEVKEAVEQLRDSAALIHERGSSKGLSLWPHSSVNLDNAMDLAEEALSGEFVGARGVAAQFTNRSVVARRHYIETGNLRHFAVRYLDFIAFQEQIKQGLPVEANADGKIVIVLTNDETEVTRSLALVREQRTNLGLLTIVGISSPVVGVAETVREHNRWNWIKTHIPDLAGDAFARSHVSREIKRCRNRIEKELYHLVQLRDAPERQATISWADVTGAIRGAAKGILPHLSTRCDGVFDKAPKVVNELINRRVTSAAASRARTDLIEAIAVAANQEYLGFDSTKSPPEMAIYRSVLLQGKVHVASKNGWRIRTAEEIKGSDPLQLSPALLRIHELLKDADIKRCAVPEIFSALRLPPYGVRDGLLPLLVALYLAGHWDQTAVYEDGTFIEKPGGDVFQRLGKEPEAFHLQHCSVRGVRLELFQRVAAVLKLPALDRPDVLAIVRPLMIFAAKLPEYSVYTERHLAATSRKARTVLREAREPATLFFADLPRALGFDVFTLKASSEKEPDPAAFAEALNRAVLELRELFSCLLKRLSISILSAFRFNGTIGEFREQFSFRMTAVQPALTDPELRVFALRISDASFGEREWTESIATYVMHKTPQRWRDVDEDEFHNRAGGLAARFTRTEAVGFNGSAIDPEKLGRAVRFTLTRPDGREVDQVVRWTARDDNALAETKRELKKLMERSGTVGLAAAAQFVWESFEQKKP